MASLLTLNLAERQALEAVVAQASLTSQARRAQALLWLDEGDTTQAIAARLHVSRQTVYNWIAGFQERRDEGDMGARLADKKRSGRPRTRVQIADRTLPQIVDPLIVAVIGRDPREFGYASILWTAKLLRHYLREVHHLAITGSQVRSALERLGTWWKPAESTIGGLPRNIALGDEASYANAERVNPSAL